jgi:hypothetical protein
MLLDYRLRFYKMKRAMAAPKAIGAIEPALNEPAAPVYTGRVGETRVPLVGAGLMTVPKV